MRKNVLKIITIITLVIISVSILVVPCFASNNGYILSLYANGTLASGEYFRVQSNVDGVVNYIHSVNGPIEMDNYDISVNTLENIPNASPLSYTIFYKFKGIINVVWYDEVTETRNVVSVTQDFQVVDLGNSPADFYIEFIPISTATTKIASFQLKFGNGVLVDDDAVDYWNGYTDGYGIGYDKGYADGLNVNNPIVSMFTDPIGALFSVTLYETNGFELTIGGIFFTFIGILLFVAFLRYFAGG